MARTRSSTFRRRFSSGDDRGAATTELVLVFPVFLTLLFLLVQAGLYYHARNLAGTAAQEAAAVASARGASAADGEAEAGRYLDDAASGLWQGSASVDVVDNGDTVRAEVGGRVQNVMPFADLVPGLSLRVDEVSERPTERFRPDGE